MANETFKYPDAIISQESLEFKTAGHLLRDKDIIEFNQLSDVSVSGVRMSKNLGNQFDRWEYAAIVPLESASETDLADVKSFVGSSCVNGILNTFVWTDHNGVEKTVRMINNPFTMQRMGDSTYYLVRFILEEENT